MENTKNMNRIKNVLLKRKIISPYVFISVISIIMIVFGVIFDSIETLGVSSNFCISLGTGLLASCIVACLISEYDKSKQRKYYKYIIENSLEFFLNFDEMDDKYEVYKIMRQKEDSVIQTIRELDNISFNCILVLNEDEIKSLNKIIASLCMLIGDNIRSFYNDKLERYYSEALYNYCYTIDDYLLSHVDVERNLSIMYKLDERSAYDMFMFICLINTSIKKIQDSVKKLNLNRYRDSMLQ